METASHGTQPNLGQLATAKITVRTAQAQGNLETPRFSPGTSGPKKVTQSVALSLCFGNQNIMNISSLSET